MPAVNFSYMIYFIVAVLFLLIFIKVIKWPLKIALKILVNGVLGVILLIFVNLIGSFFSFSIGINWVTALIAGFFGIPGVVFLIIFKLFF